MSVAKTAILIDQHPLLLEALAERLESTLNIDVLSCWTNSDPAFLEILNRQPDLVILDLELPGRGAIEVANQIASRLPATRTLILTDYQTDIYIDVALRIEVAGYLLKSEPVATILDGIRRISLGETVYSDAIRDRMACDAETRKLEVKSQSFFSSLTLRQIQVLRHLARGDSVKEVAKALALSERAIESHKYRIMQKMGIHDRVVLTRFAIREGLMPA